MRDAMIEKIRHYQDKCDFCGTCVAVCPHDAIELAEASLQILFNRCTLCAFCIQGCPTRALEMSDESAL